VIGEEIRKARLAANLSQEELGFKANLSRNYISMVEIEPELRRRSKRSSESAGTSVSAPPISLQLSSKRWTRKNRPAVQGDGEARWIPRPTPMDKIIK